MFGFKDFLIESSLKDLIGSVPQNQKWHGEGNVGVHTKLVQKQLNQAITTFQDLVRSPNSPLSEMNPEFTQEDRNLLRVAAWTHDLGKASSTTADGMDWRNAPPNPDKITSPKHEMPHHFNPNAQELLKSNMWRSIFDKVSFEDKKDLWFVIRNHMSLLEGGLSRKLLRRFIQPNGKYINNRRLKLLLTFILMESFETPPVLNILFLSSALTPTPVSLTEKIILLALFFFKVIDILPAIV